MLAAVRDDPSTNTAAIATQDTMVTMQDTVESHTRTLVQVEPCSGRFHTPRPDYTQQYAGLYFARLQELRPRIVAHAEQHWVASDSSISHVPRIPDVERGRACFVVGTLFVEQLLKPNVLTDLAKEQPIVRAIPHRKHVDPTNDEVVLEDEFGRVTLIGDRLQSEMLVTGVVVGILGCEVPSGDFEVIDVLYPGTQDILQRPLPQTSDANEQFIAIVSGLAPQTEADPSVELALLSRFLMGEYAMANISARITALFVAGNSLLRPAGMIGTSESASVKMTKGVQNRKDIKQLTEQIAVLDTFLTNVSRTMNVVLIPGERDPASLIYPQQPLAPGLFPSASKLNAFITESNPVQMDIGGINVLGTAGQNIDSVFDGVECEDRLIIARNMLRWGHLAPTSPDTLWSFPLGDKDPCVLQGALPHILFAGNQPEYATRCYTNGEGPSSSQTRVVLVPQFSKTRSIVLVSLSTLQTQELFL